MKKFATYSDLERFSGDALRLNENIVSKAFSESSEKNTFLSYSSKDFKLLPGVISVLNNNGAKVYIDKMDEQLPKEPDENTGVVLKKRILECNKFVLFPTNNSENSRWVPWELGLADGSIRKRNVALFPSSEKEYEMKWTEIEYLGLYERIIWGNFADKEPEWLVYNHHTNTADRLCDWIRKIY